MSPIITVLLVLVAAAVCGALGFYLGGENRKRTAEAKIGSAEDEAKRIVNDAIKAANDAKTKAENDLTAANTARETAEGSLTAVINDLDSLSDSVKNAADNKAKVQVIRDIVTRIPGTGTVSHQEANEDNRFADIATDPINSFENE